MLGISLALNIDTRQFLLQLSWYSSSPLPDYQFYCGILQLTFAVPGTALAECQFAPQLCGVCGTRFCATMEKPTSVLVFTQLYGKPLLMMTSIPLDLPELLTMMGKHVPLWVRLGRKRFQH